MKYNAYIFDLDGTLYHLLPVRVYMLLRLILHYSLRPHKIRELLALRMYRRLREERFGCDAEDFGRVQVERAAWEYGLDTEYVRGVISLWMNRIPLRAVRFFRRRKLLRLIKSLQASGKIIVVYSDYPVKEKLDALKLSPNYQFWSEDGVIECMKPDSSGITRAVDALGLGREEILYVGDRYDRDGLCAEEAGFGYMDVREFVKKIHGGV